MAITNLSDLANRLTGGSSGTPQHAWFYFENRIAASSTVQTAIGRIRSLWKQNKSNGAHGATPASTTMTVCSTATLGSLPLAASIQSTGLYTYLVGMDAMAAGTTSAGTYMVYDRLAANAGLVHNVNTEQGCANSSGEVVSVTRYASTVSTDPDFAGGNQIWLEVYTALSATAALASVKYTNQAGTTGRTSQSVLLGGANSSAVGSVVAVPLASSDSGVIGVQSVTMASSQGTAGSFGVTIARPLLTVPVNVVGGGATRDTLSGLPAMPRIEPGACLAFTLLPVGVGDPAGFISCHFVDA